MDYIYTIVRYNRLETIHEIPKNIIWFIIYIKQIAPAYIIGEMLRNPDICCKEPSHTPQTIRMIHTLNHIRHISYKRLLQIRAKRLQRIRNNSFNDRQSHWYYSQKYMFEEMIFSNFYHNVKQYIQCPWFNYSFLMDTRLIREFYCVMDASMIYLILSTWIYHIRPNISQCMVLLSQACIVRNKYFIRIMCYILSQTLTEKEKQKCKTTKLFTCKKFNLSNKLNLK